MRGGAKVENWTERKRIFFYPLGLNMLLGSGQCNLQRDYQNYSAGALYGSYPHIYRHTLTKITYTRELSSQTH